MIHNEDCMATMSRMDDGSVDLIVTSPPYNLRNTTGGGLHSRNSRWGNAALKQGYTDHDDMMPHDEYVAWQRKCLTEMMRVIPDTGAIYYNHKWRVQDGLLQGREDIMRGFPVRQIIIWQRAGGFNWNQHYYLPTYEVIYLVAKPDFRLAPGANKHTDIWHITPDLGTRHPAPFPEELARRCISSTDARIVYDPFMGSGTTAVAAKSLGRVWIGSETSPEYCRIARERLAQEVLI
ncbi:MAG: site-specific DNA-methyltransferase [Alphaproteobacteria bacterium]|nr:site-specific DNA-methyltransferase [Alphaproteobacteria bacterium]MDA8029838.1 site-specific DNA-methyltransferase [Alphaproteobacteria bacterium]